MRPAQFLLFCLWFGPIAGVATSLAATPGGRAAPPAGPQRELLIQNRSSQAITEVFATPTNLDDWGDDRLAGETIPAGKPFRVRLGASRECNWDIKVTYNDRSTEESRDANLCRLRQVTFDGSTAVAAPVDPGPERTVTVQNASVRRIDQVFISAVDADSWDENRLADQIASGGSEVVPFSGDCLADVRVVYETRAAEERRGLDLCKFSRLMITPGWTLAEDPSAEPEPPRGEQTVLVNRSGHAIIALYVFPDGRERGEDRLGLATLANDDRKQIELGRGQPCFYTIRAVFVGAPPDLERTGVNLCRTGQVDITDAAIREVALQ